jgi:hypothetical protein
LSTNNLTIKDLTISNIYVKAQCVSPYTGCDEGGQNTGGIAANGTNVTISGSTIHDAKWCVTGGVPGNVTIANRSIHDNAIYNCDHAIAVGVSAVNGVLNGLYIYNNDIHDFVNWDDDPAVNNNHHDGIHIWSYNSGDLITGGLIYDNYIHGDFGHSFNAAIYTEAQTGLPSAYFFNNVLIDQSTVSHLGCGLICLIDNDAHVFNNTINGAASVDAGTAINNYGENVTIESNIIVGVGQALGFSGGGAFATVDYNNYYQIGAKGWNFYGTLAAWQSGCSCDSHSSNTNPNLTPNYRPTSISSALIVQGVNLSNLSIPPLNLDMLGVPRPPSTNWTVGAYQYQPGPVLNPPTGLSALVH